MKVLFKVMISALAALGVISAEAQSKMKLKYGETIVFAQDQKLEFPDFTLVYTGRKVTGHLPGNPFVESSSQNFTVLKDGKEIEHISQSAGFGSLADDMSSHFVIGDQIFELNFGSAFVNFKTVKMNQLRENQLPGGGVFSEVMIDAGNESMTYSYKDGDSYRYGSL